LFSGLERGHLEETGGGEATTHVSEKLRLASYGRHRRADLCLVPRSFQAEVSIDRVGVVGPIHQDRFGSELLRQPPSTPPELVTQSGVVELLIAGFGPPSQQTAVKGIMHNEWKIRHLSGFYKRLKDWPVLRNLWQVEGS
jgi:hypothetical protein